MKILVCLKQVPDTNDIKWTENNTMQRDGVESIINPYDLYALEEALKIKKYNNDTEIIAITMGPLQAESILKKAIALGCDRGILLSDKKFAGSDTYATAKIISQAISAKIPDFDLIFCGQFAIDGDTAQTGPGIATNLNIPQITFAKNLDRYDGKSVYVQRELESGIETVRTTFPVLICMLKGDYETSRVTINGIRKANSTHCEIYSADDIGLSPEKAGIKGSPTYVSKAFRPEHNRDKCKFINEVGTLAKTIKEFIDD